MESVAVSFPCDLTSLPTPCLLVDEDLVKKNCQDMIQRCKAAGVKLRPHIKTHKTSEITKYQMDDGGAGICVGVVASTIPELRLLAEASVLDITYAVPIGIGAPLPLLLTILRAHPKMTINLFIDSELSLRAVETFTASASSDLPSLRWGAFLKIDAGYHRAGVDITESAGADRAAELAHSIARSPAVRFLGLYSHSGDAYSAAGPAEAREVGRQECQRAAALAGRLRREGLEVGTVSVGSTPACACTDAAASDAFAGASEIHPGNYVFFDRQQAAVGACHGEEGVAVTVLTRIVGHYRAHMLCDAGALCMSKDLSPQGDGFGVVLGQPLRLAAVSQELGRLVRRSPESADDSTAAAREEGEEGQGAWSSWAVGSLLRIVPNHSCLTAACHPVYYVMRDGKAIGVWRPCRGW